MSSSFGENYTKEVTTPALGDIVNYHGRMETRPESSIGYYEHGDNAISDAHFLAPEETPVDPGNS